MNIKLYNRLTYLFTLIIGFFALPTLYGSSFWPHAGWWMLASLSMIPIWTHRFYIFQAPARTIKSGFSKGPYATMFWYGYFTCVLSGFVGFASALRVFSFGSAWAAESLLMAVGWIGVLSLTAAMPALFKHLKVDARVLSEFRLTGNLSVGFALLFMLLLFWWLTTPTVYPSG